MKTSREQIMMTALRLFAERGYDAVSTGMLAEELGITKGALYRHFAGKREIYDSIIRRMFELDAQRAAEDHVPEKEFSEDAESYAQTELTDLCTFVCNQFDFWTGDEFASLFRRMITIDQFKTPESGKLYQDVIALGPVRYTEDLMGEMLRLGRLNEQAAAFGARNLAVQLFAPLQLMIQLADGGCDRTELRLQLAEITKEFAARWQTEKKEENND